MQENDFGYVVGCASVALNNANLYVWDCSVIEAEGMYHMFCSAWDRRLGFGWNWMFNSKICRFVSDTPQGPYRFANEVLPRRGREFFDGMNTHNTCIRSFGGKYYLYYMGTTYGGSIPGERENIDPLRAAEVWNRKRIGVAVADRIDGVFERRAAPLLEPRDCSKWDCTCTTNPAVTILPSGKTYMIYKSRRYAGAPLQLGVAVAERPDGVFERLSDAPIFAFDDENIHVEDPFLWYDEARKKFCVLVKDDSKNGVFGITGEWGSGFYAESDDCVHFSVPKNSKVYSRTVRWQNGRTAIQCNLERPWILFDAKNRPARLFCATGNGSAPYAFEGNTYIISFDFNTR